MTKSKKARNAKGLTQPSTMPAETPVESGSYNAKQTFQLEEEGDNFNEEVIKKRTSTPQKTPTEVFIMF